MYRTAICVGVRFCKEPPVPWLLQYLSNNLGFAWARGYTRQKKKLIAFLKLPDGVQESK